MLTKPRYKASKKFGTPWLFPSTRLYVSIKLQRPQTPTENDFVVHDTLNKQAK